MNSKVVFCKDEVKFIVLYSGEGSVRSTLKSIFLLYIGSQMSVIINKSNMKHKEVGQDALQNSVL